MFSQSILPLLHSYRTICLQCPLIERANVLDYLVQQFNLPLFSWNLAAQQIRPLKGTEIDSNCKKVSPSTAIDTELEFNTIKSVLLTWQQRQDSVLLLLKMYYL